MNIWEELSKMTKGDDKKEPPHIVLVWDNYVSISGVNEDGKEYDYLTHNTPGEDFQRTIYRAILQYDEKIKKHV